MMAKEAGNLSEMANRNTITVGHARVMASVKYKSLKYKDYAVTWHLVGGRTTKSKLTAIAHAKKINFLIERSKKVSEVVSDEKRQYNAGSEARKRGVDKADCPFEAFQMKLRGWWLAGWHDADMESKND